MDEWIHGWIEADSVSKHGTDNEVATEFARYKFTSYLLKALDSMEPALELRALLEGRGMRFLAASGSSASISRIDSGSIFSLYSRTTHSIMFFQPDLSESPYLHRQEDRLAGR